jgi:hypothetical protein
MRPFYSTIDWTNPILKKIQKRNNEIEERLEEMVKNTIKERLIKGNLSM